MVELERCRQVLVYGGSFDPPHLAHVRLPMLAADALGAEAVVYVPAARSPHKLNGPAPAAGSHRLAMLRLALADQPRAVILTDELDQAGEGPSYTVDTLERLHDRLGWGKEQGRERGGGMRGGRLLIGGDQARQFHRWYRADRIAELAEPLVMIRPPDSLESFLAGFPEESARQLWSKRLIGLPLMDISSRDVRRRLAHGDDVSDRLAPAVSDYIRGHGLYGGYGDSAPQVN